MMSEITKPSARATLLAMMMFGSLLSSGANARPHLPTEKLHLEVYTAGDAEFHVTATLIHGKTEGLLVDTQFHDDAVKKLVETVAGAKLKLKGIFITHPDGDHYGGIAALKTAFPDTPIYMTERGLAEFKKTMNPAKRLPIPDVLPGREMSVDGQAVDFIEDLQGDYAPSPANTPVWIPSLRALIADDLVFRGVHPWLTDSTSQTRAAWRRSLQRLAALHPKKLIAGHQLGHEANSPSEDLEFTDRYIAAFDETARTASDAAAFMRAMEGRFPDLGGHLLLEYGAKSVYAKQPPP